MGEEAIKIGGNKWIKRKKVKEENGEEEKSGRSRNKKEAKNTDDIPKRKKATQWMASSLI